MKLCNYSPSTSLPCLHILCIPLSLSQHCIFPQIISLAIWFIQTDWLVSPVALTVALMHFLNVSCINFSQGAIIFKGSVISHSFANPFYAFRSKLHIFIRNSCHVNSAPCCSSKTGEGKLSLSSPPPFFLPPTHFFSYCLLVTQPVIYLCTRQGRLWVAVQVTGFSFPLWTTVEFSLHFSRLVLQTDDLKKQISSVVSFASSFTRRRNVLSSHVMILEPLLWHLTERQA